HYGHVLVVGGDLGTAGAARMAAESAARCGAGLTSVATRPEHAALAALRPELMFHGVQGPKQLAPLLEKASVVALGPGLGRQDWGYGLWRAVLEGEGALVVDADGLNLLAVEPRRRDNWVLTPHPGEAARLLDCSPQDIQKDRFAAARELVDRYGGVVVLKGAGSLVAGPDEPPTIIGAGNPGMASGGMGDVLTGVIAALLAQGLTPWQAARSGAWVHARAADLAAREGGERGLLALDLLPYLRSGVNPR
ncbi:MAG: NAD(P)H-hydrate dehydratase, partial [Candidatus Competibacteraceae bacterium]|nr:NAD(P)H-hydrate dehydratase [Candidatus Competibacteraceae bacterium]